MSGPSGSTDRGELTGQQRRPLDVERASVALSAGAGCGKTKVLTERFLLDLARPERRPLRSIVALTFTEKAARELRQRIRAVCRDRLESGADPTRWRSILRGLEAAPIGTFHQFCGQLLRRHAVEAGLDPEFTVLDETIAGTVRDEALAACLRDALTSSDPDLIELAVEFGLNRVREALYDLISQRVAGDLDAWARKTPDEILALWTAAWEREVRQPRFEEVVRTAKAALDLLGRHPCSNPKIQAACEFLVERLPNIERDGTDEAWLQEIRDAINLRGARKTQWSSADVYEAVKLSLQGLRDAVDDLLDARSWNEAVSRETAEHGLRYARLAVKVRQLYQAAKQARGGLDYDDLLLNTRDLLRQHVEIVRNHPDGAIDLLLVDEFQDTDPIQSEILEHLAGDSFAAGRLFLVGDVKQSIYRFRGAKPELFGVFRDRFPKDGHHSLTENFRSAPGILDFVNALLADLYDDACDALQPGPRTPKRDERPAVEFLWAADDAAAESSKPGASERRKLEARWIALRLRERLEDGWIIRDRRTGQTRQAHAGDVALLFRSMVDLSDYERALADQGFDYHIVGGSAFFVQQEITDVANVLSAIEDPFDGVALAAALRSPFFCLSDDALFWLGTSARGDLIAALRDAATIAELSQADQRRAGRAFQLLAEWRAAKDHGPIAALVDRVLDESGFEAALLGERLGDRKRANARKLVRMARDYDQQGGFTLADFVARLRSDLRKTPREEQAATTDEEGTSLRLMSIHQAKGLEFPIVVLPDLNRAPNPSRSSVAFHPELGLIVRPAKDGLAADGGDSTASSSKSVGCQAYDAWERREDEEESLRLLYVATTRARDALILSAGLAPDDKPASAALRLIDERFERESGECKAPLPSGWHPPVVEVIRQCPSPPPRELRSRPRTPRLRAVAQAILRPTVQPAVESHGAARVPRVVDLSPDRRLSPSAARLDRLVRAILADPGAFRRSHLPEVAARLGKGQVPAARPALVASALERLAAWIDGPLGRDIAGADEVVRGLEWTYRWPERDDATTFLGRLDLAFRDREGAWQLVGFGDVAAPESLERLRLMLSARVAQERGWGPVERAWLIRLGSGGGLLGEERFDDSAIHTAAARVFRDLAAAPVNGSP